MTRLPKFVSAQEVADSFGLSRVRTLLDWHRAGRFPKPYRIGGRWMFREDEVRRWSEEQARDAEQEALRLDYLKTAALGGRRPRQPRGSSAQPTAQPTRTRGEASAAQARSDSGRFASGSSDASS